MVMHLCTLNTSACKVLLFYLLWLDVLYNMPNAYQALNAHISSPLFSALQAKLRRTIFVTMMMLTTDSTWNSARMLFPPLEHTRFWYNVLASMAFTRLDFQNWHSRPIFMVAFSPIFWQFQRFLLDSKLGWKCLWQVGKKESCSRITRF